MITMEEEFKEIKEEDLPCFYRLILKVPGAEFLENAGGVFWAILMPIFLAFEYFLNIYFLISFPFPANVVLILIVPTVTFVLFVKISLKRFITWWNANFGKSHFEWNIEKTINEYLNLLEENEVEEKPKQQYINHR